MKKTALIIVICLVFNIFFTSCIYTDASEGLESGFKFSAPDSPQETPPSPPSRFCAYRSDKSEFNINFVILDFYYGAYYPSGIDFELETGDNFPYFELYFANDDGDEFFVKRINENFVSEKYSCDVVKNDFNYIIEVKFNHSERLQIPKKIFTKENGVIYFEICSKNPRESDPKLRVIASTKIYYRAINNKVILSAEEIK